MDFIMAFPPICVTTIFCSFVSHVKPKSKVVYVCVCDMCRS